MAKGQIQWLPAYGAEKEASIEDIEIMLRRVRAEIMRREVKHELVP